MLDWFSTLMVSLFSIIDRIIAYAIQAAYKLFTLIADTSIFSTDIILMFSQRVYALLGIFMLFKVAFSLINYIINPDDFTDKSKGAGKLLTNVLVALLLIVSVPKIFDLAYQFQGLILKNNVIPKVILGVGGSDNFVYDDDTPGKMMSFMVYTAFITPNPEYPDMGTKCDNLYQLRDLNDPQMQECKAVMDKALGSNGVIKLNNAIKTYDPYLLLDWDIITAKDNGEFAFNYTYILSSICAAVVAWVIIIFCIDISIRVVKLGFLQLIAPIPIVSYVDPKSSKEGMFKKWTKTCISTYMDIFVRLAAISFAIFIIGIIGTGHFTRISNPGEEIGFTTHPFVKIFVLLGALMFAKQLPKLIEDLTGIKMSGDFTLNPMKKLGASPFAAAAIGGAAGLIGGGIANTYALGSNIKNDGLKKALMGDSKGAKGLMRAAGTVFSPGAGAISSMIRSGKGAMGGKDMGKGIKSGIQASVDARDLRDKRQDVGYGLGTRTMDSLRSMSGVDTNAKGKANEIKNRITDMKRQQSQYDRIAEDIAINRKYTPEEITKYATAKISVDAVTGDRTVTYADGTFGTYNSTNAAGKDLEQYINAINKSTATSVDIIKETKKLKIYEAEDKK